jgi:hypothetical protein
MAGSFGYESDHYGISMSIGERVLLPEVRRAPLDALVVADGFSCREQIAQGTARQALHLADVLAMAMREGPRGPGAPYPESLYIRAPARPAVGALLVIGAAVCALGASVAVRTARRRA